MRTDLGRGLLNTRGLIRVASIINFPSPPLSNFWVLHQTSQNGIWIILLSFFKNPTENVSSKVFEWFFFLWIVSVLTYEGFFGQFLAFKKPWLHRTSFDEIQQLKILTCVKTIENFVLLYKLWDQFRFWIFVLKLNKCTISDEGVSCRSEVRTRDYLHYTIRNKVII